MFDPNPQMLAMLSDAYLGFPLNILFDLKLAMLCDLV